MSFDKISELLELLVTNCQDTSAEDISIEEVQVLVWFFIIL